MTRERYVGLDAGAETIKAVELTRDAPGASLRVTRQAIIEHHKGPQRAIIDLLGSWSWDELDGAAISGRFSRRVGLLRVPTKQAQARGFRFRHGDGPATIVSIGSHGFSVLELRPSGAEVFRENSRCSQGTGNFLRQLVERFDLTIDAASELCATVSEGAPLSGRCPVILKTDMTHLANKGEDKARILAGLYDAVCENVQVLIKPRVSPARVALIGGVGRSKRIRDNFARFLERHDMELLPADQKHDLHYLEALGTAHVAAERRLGTRLLPLEQLFTHASDNHLEEVPGLAGYLEQVTRMRRRPRATVNGGARQLVVGFDIGSTGSKAVAVTSDEREVVWEGYVSTGGNPVGAAQTLMAQFVDGAAGTCDVVAVGATGSGREIVGSLMTTCYGGDAVYVLNEIAAHAEGALHFDPRVDTIFEIGGQDAKYIRLQGGRVIDAAMNEACSAGTGSFIEEQGRKFSGIDDVVQLGREGLAAERGVSLGQHCSVFMAEIIDEAVAAGVDNATIIAGIYDSIIQNYLNRVKGSRDVGEVIFCQGMPFSADALAAAVVRQTGAEVIIPPNPGTVGALGIALLTLNALDAAALETIDPQRFLSAELRKKETFICKATKGCEAPGNLCRIDRIRTSVDDVAQRFTWGGGCSLWDQGTQRQKLPDRAPDPFRGREALVADLVARHSQRRGRKRVALADEFQLKGMFPFFATFIHELGFDLDIHTGADQSALKRGIEEANVPFCAPMQQYHGLVSEMADTRPDFLFVPMVRNTPRTGEENHSVTCPIVQACPDMLRKDLGESGRERLISPVIDLGTENMGSAEFRHSCHETAQLLGIRSDTWVRAFDLGLAAQQEFDAECGDLGRRALDFARAHDITPVVVLGRPYTIYNKVLNSNVPAILREQGAIGIPVDCFPIADDIPVFEDVFWGFGQRNLRVAFEIRRTAGVYTMWCSNYSCGPDSFNLHFYANMMTGKPFTVIETDGHSGDAGTKTRVEAFLHCVREDLALPEQGRREAAPVLRSGQTGFEEIKAKGQVVLIPRMGPTADVVAASFRGLGLRAESLPTPTRETVAVGRRYTSGKECVPMTITLGSYLQRLERGRDSNDDFSILMPGANGPCRFGAYHILLKIIIEQLGWQDRVNIWTPMDSGYFDDVPASFSTVAFACFVAGDLLLEGLYHTRPIEKTPGAALAIYERFHARLVAHVEAAAGVDMPLPAALLQVANGRMFGIADLMREAAAAFAAVATDKQIPTVLVVGEIYVRCDPFSNDFVIDKLEQRGIRSRFAPFTEWLEYTDYINKLTGLSKGFGDQLSSLVQRIIMGRSYGIMQEALGWPPRTTVKETVAAGRDLVRPELCGEAILTVGVPVHEHRQGFIDAVVNVGPLECMPTKIAQAQLFHVGEEEGLLSLTLALNGDPMDPEVLDNFAFEVHAHFRRRQAGEKPSRKRRKSFRDALPLMRGASG